MFEEADAPVVEDGDCIGTVNSFNAQCEVLTNQADCESEGTDQFATGVCDWSTQLDISYF